MDGIGETIRVQRVPTQFGQVSFTMTQPDDHSARIRLDTQWKTRPRAVYLHLPWFVNVSGVWVDGEPTAHASGIVKLPTNSREVRLSWTRRANAPDWSFENAVRNYEQEYRRHYEIYMHGGQSGSAALKTSDLKKDPASP